LFRHPIEDPKEGKRGEIRFGHSIKFDNVSFSYEKLKGAEVLSDVSLEIKRGERIGIVGPSGVGKSTFIQLLLRFYEVSAGEILMDERNINKYPMKSYRRMFGVVSQEIELFGRTILENISYGNPFVSRAEVIRAAKYARAYEFIELLPDKFDTVLGENGYTLSGGQRQRMCIARALIGDPDILIFDEATNALDASTELGIRVAMDDLLRDKTVIVISHRLSSIRDLDRIFVLEGGRILESGSHSALMDIPDGKYRRLVEIHEREIE
jgi:ATP-binding cassette, subfamily B, bacterial